MGKKREVKAKEGSSKPGASKKQKEQDPDIDDIVEDKEEELNEDEIDETYSDLDDDELLALALKDDDEDAGEGSKSTDSELKKKKKSGKRPFQKTNVLYLGHIPHGFFEEQIKAFFAQFGKVLQVRVSRSKKTGKSRGYAFVQFLHKDVANIVQKTMHGYILTGRSIVCQHVPEEHVHEKMFLGGLSGKNSKVNTYPEARKKRVLAHAQRSTSEEGQKRRLARLKKADKRRKDILAEKGIKYDFVGGYAEQK